MNNRILLSSSSIYKSFEEAGKPLDLSMLNKDNFIRLKDIESTLNEIKMRNLPLVPMILNALEMGKIVLTKSASAGSSIQIVPSASDKSLFVDRVFVNCSLIAKPSKSVNHNTGDIEEIMTIKSYEELYNILLGAFVALNTEKLMSNMTVFKEIGESYIDIVAQILSRSFGNPMDGDKLRFIIKMFYLNGVISGTDLAGVEKYNIDSANMLSSKYPEFFSTGPKTLESMLEVIDSEFTSMKDVTLKKFIGECTKTLGSNGVFLIDNYPYMLSVFVNRMRKDRSGVYNGYLLRVIDPVAKKLLSEIQRAII